MCVCVWGGGGGGLGGGEMMRSTLKYTNNADLKDTDLKEEEKTANECT